MAKRGGPSISVKMILTTTLLIVVTVVGSGFLNVVNVRRELDKSATERIQDFTQGRVTLGELGTPLFARAMEQLLIDHGRDADIQVVVQSTVTGDTKDSRGGKKDLGLALALVLDPNQNVIAACTEGAKLDCKPGNHQPVGATFGPIAVEAWQKSLAAWKAAKKGEALVESDLTNGGAKFAVFAYPVFVGEPPTNTG